MRYSFAQFLKVREYGGSVVDPSGVEDEGDGGDRLEKRLEKPGAFPTYGNDLPITAKNRRNFMKKGCNCSKKR